MASIWLKLTILRFGSHLAQPLRLGFLRFGGPEAIAIPKVRGAVWGRLSGILCRSTDATIGGHCVRYDCRVMRNMRFTD